ncbi:MAG: DUF11 domain-containing protein, partial [Chloroflexi bacterium]|nr:DUF11 domain-containing protein [Chloroflexota bacterium]
SSLSNGSFLNWTGLSVSAGQMVVLTYQATIKTGLAGGTLISNQATVTDRTPGGTGSSQIATAPDLTLTTSVISALKSVTGQSGPGNQAQPGDVVAYTITVFNSGSRDATGMVVTDTLVLGYLDTPSFISDSGSYDTATRTITWSNISVPANSQRALSFHVMVLMPSGTPPPYVISNGAVISPPLEGGSGNTAQAPDLFFGTPDLSSSIKGVAIISSLAVSSTIGVTTPVLPAPVFTATVPISLLANPGDWLVYTVRVVNTGVISATGVTIRDVLDANLDGPPTEISNGGSYDAALRTITWNNLVIPAAPQKGGGVLELTFKARVKLTATSGSFVNNTALITPPVEGGPVSTPSAPPVEVIIPLIQINKTARVVVSASGNAITNQPSNQARLGDTVEYTVTLTNTGKEALTNLNFTDGYDYSANDGAPNMRGTIYLGQAQANVLVGQSSILTTTQPTIAQEPGLNTSTGLLVVQVPRLEIGQALVVKFQAKFSSNLTDFTNGRVENQAFASSSETSVLTNNRLPSDDPTTPAVNDPTITSLLQDVPPPTVTPQPTPTIPVVPAQTGFFTNGLNGTVLGSGNSGMVWVLGFGTIFLLLVGGGGYGLWRWRSRSVSSGSSSRHR